MVILLNAINLYIVIVVLLALLGISILLLVGFVLKILGLWKTSESRRHPSNEITFNLVVI